MYEQNTPVWTILWCSCLIGDGSDVHHTLSTQSLVDVGQQIQMCVIPHVLTVINQFQFVSTAVAHSSFRWMSGKLCRKKHVPMTSCCKNGPDDVNEYAKYSSN